MLEEKDAINHKLDKFYIQEKEWYDKEPFEYVEPVINTVDDHETETNDARVDSKVTLPNAGTFQTEKVIKCRRNEEGNLISSKSTHQLYNTSI